MTLEDFLTMTEMSNGLATPARVQELLSVMQKEKESGTKNPTEVTRQWSTIASSIAATENRECLQLFVQLDGLYFMDSWLKDAQKLSSDTNDSIAEETISHLLQAVEKLHLDKEKVVSSGIMVTVKNLLDHKSSKIQEKSKALLDSWEKGKDDVAVSESNERVDASIDGRTNVVENFVGETVHSEPSLTGISPSKSEVEKCGEQIGENNHLCSRSNDAHPSTIGDTMESDQNLQATMLKDGSPSSPSSAKSVSEGKEKEAYHAVGSGNSTDTCGSRDLKDNGIDEQTDVTASESINCLNCIQEVTPDKLDAAVQPMDEKTISLDPDANESSEAVPAPDVQSQNDVIADDTGKIPSDDASIVISMEKIEPDSSLPANNGSNTTLGPEEERKNDIDILESSNEPKMEHIEGLSTDLMEVDAVDGEEKHSSSESEDEPENATVFELPQRGSTVHHVLEKKCDIELDYGIIDPLELARQVAIEVEREVGESCSSSEKTQESNVHEADSTDSGSVNGSNKELPKGVPVLTEASHSHLEAGPMNGKDKLESSQIINAALDLESNDQKSQCGFDLNLEVGSDDLDRSGNPTSISVVSASRASAAPGAPVPPLQFEGTLGWKGSAATSAFRPASPRKFPESDRAVSSGGSDSISKQPQSCLDIDLNVAEGGDDKPTDLIPGKQVSVSSAFPSGDSSVDASPKRLAKLELDLNCASEEGEAPTNWGMERRLFPEKGDWSHSPSSSTSSKKPSVRNFDLNDQPTFLHDSSELSFFKKPSQYSNTSGGIKSGDSVVSIMGMKIEVNHNDPVPRPVLFPNSRIVENAVDLGVPRSGFLGMASPFPFTHSPSPGYNGVTPGPVMPFPSAMYGQVGPIPYMVDSRGSPVVPQIVGSASAIPPSFSHQPFLISMNGAPVPNGMVPSRNSMDLNTGLILEGGPRDHGSTRQFFHQGLTRSVDDHFRTVSGPSTSSNIGVKRKEPDDSWEPFPFKHHPPPWK